MNIEIKAIIIITIIWVIYILFTLWYCYKLYKLYNQDQQEQDERILVLEKRITDIKKDLTWQIQWETKLRQDFEEITGNEFLRIKRQLKKKSDKE